MSDFRGDFKLENAEKRIAELENERDIWRERTERHEARLAAVHEALGDDFCCSCDDDR